MVVVWEIVFCYVEDFLCNVGKMLMIVCDQDDLKLKVEVLECICECLVEVCCEMKVECDEIYQQIIKNGVMIVQIEYIECLMYGNLFMQFVVNLCFGC